MRKFLWNRRPSAERAAEAEHAPCYLLGAAAGSHHRVGAPVHNAPDYATSAFKTLAPRLYAMAGVGPDDVDVLQSYENFTGGVLMSIVEHGFCEADGCNEFFVKENLVAPGGTLPLNTSGGNLAECYMHGLGLNIEAVRQVRGRIYSYERVWHPVHPALKYQGPYLIVLVEFPDQDGVRMIGNLLGDPEQEVIVGAPVKAVFEHHPDDDPPYTLVQWTTWNLNA